MITVKLVGTDGNIFSLLGIVNKALKDNGQKEKATALAGEILNAESYSEALQIIKKYVNIE